MSDRHAAKIFSKRKDRKSRGDRTVTHNPPNFL